VVHSEPTFDLKLKADAPACSGRAIGLGRPSSTSHDRGCCLIDRGSAPDKSLDGASRICQGSAIQMDGIQRRRFGTNRADTNVHVKSRIARLRRWRLLAVAAAVVGLQSLSLQVAAAAPVADGWVPVLTVDAGTTASMTWTADRARCAAFLAAIGTSDRSLCTTQITVAAPATPTAIENRAGSAAGISTASASSSCYEPVTGNGYYYHVGWDAHVVQAFRVCFSPDSVRATWTDCSNWHQNWPYTFQITWCGAGTQAGTWADGGENATVCGPLGCTGVGYRIKLTVTGQWTFSCWNAIC
jgi:hypothetical protein